MNLTPADEITNLNASQTQLASNIRLLPIYELLKEEFFVPSYQRGYRWTQRQVLELLQDIEDFRATAEKDDFYCLQPVVVKQHSSNGWEVIDGQQRLTTVYIILSYFNRRFTEEFRKELYSISYETRPNSSEFLANINDNEKDTYIDYHFMHSTFTTVREWFRDKQNSINDFESALLNRVKIIWYEAEETVNSIDIFTRINMGKIPLTNAELIKALFLRKGNFIRSDEQVWLKQVQIAAEWDRIEYALQRDEFWYFIHDNPRPYETRIDFIFDLMKGKKVGDDPHFTFYKFNDDFKNGADVDQLWKDIKDYFLTFEDWFNDPQLYHMIGYLVTVSPGARIASLKVASQTRTKAAFVEYLKTEIKKIVSVPIDDLNFERKGSVKNVLLLFNIQTLLDNEQSYIRFPFDRYKLESWDIEHIRSSKADISSNEERKKWLIAMLEYLSGKERKEDVTEDIISKLEPKQGEYVTTILRLLEESRVPDNEFNDLYNELLIFFKENTETEADDDICNLTLLDSSTNRGYKNDFFPVKRRKIICKDKEGTFVPICTKNVFLKYYSRKLDGMFYWDERDAVAYFDAIKTTLSEYLPKQN